MRTEASVTMWALLRTIPRFPSHVVLSRPNCYAWGLSLQGSYGRLELPYAEEARRRPAVSRFESGTDTTPISVLLLSYRVRSCIWQCLPTL